MPATSLDLSQIKTDALSSASAFRSLIGLGTLATQSATITDYLTIASAVLNFQPLDSDLTSIAALSTTAFGRGLLTEASATTARSTLGLGTLATQSPTGTPSASTFLRGDFSWQTIDLSGYVPYTGATGAVNLGSNALTASRATLATGTITASTPAINVSQTWNNAATTFTGILSNVTDTASNASSLLMDLQTGGTSRFKVFKNGAVSSTYFSADNYTINAAYYSATGFYVCRSDIGSYIIGAADDVRINRDAANTLAQRNSTNAQTFRVYNLFTDSSNYERAKIEWSSNVLRIGTEKAGTGSARALELQTDGVTRLTIATNGVVATSAGLEVAGSLLFLTPLRSISRFVLRLPSDGVWTLTNWNETGWDRLQLGGSTSSFPAIKRNAAALNFRLADDSGDCDITAKAATFSGSVTVSAVNLVTDTTTGTKIGTGTTQKLGFYNSTPVVQPTAVADATDAASVITQLNALLSRMRDLGLIAT